MKRDRITILLFHSLAGNLSPNETAEVHDWVAASPGNQAMVSWLHNEPLGSHLTLYRSIDTSQGLNKLMDRINVKKKVIKLRRLTAVAAIILGVSVIVYLSINPKSLSPVVQHTPLNPDSIPIPIHPQLTLSSGSLIRLDSLPSGTLSEEGDLVIKVDSDNHIVYSHNNISAHQHLQPVYNTLALPKRKVWKITLPEGTTIWVDGGSTLSYPITSGQSDRVLSLRGKGYFDVATEYSDKKKKKFIVNANGVETEVTGTRFTISAYPGDSVVKTILLSGSVKVTDQIRRVQLKPAQAATFNRANGDVKYQKIDTFGTLNWVTGLIDFGDLPASESFKLIEQAYNVQIVYANEKVYMEMKDVKLLGSMYTDVPIERLAENLERMFRIEIKSEGNKLTIKGRQKE